jgi:histidine triad (HIT) family protein
MPIDVPQQERCPFCNFIAEPTRFATVEETSQTVAFLPPRQHGKGHVLVIPKRHARTLLELEREEALAIMQHVHRVSHAIAKAFDPAGLNVFQNNGITAGQTVPHYHVHIVPSYPGDPVGRIFRAEEFERQPPEVLLATAAAIAAHLEPAPEDYA